MTETNNKQKNKKDKAPDGKKAFKVVSFGQEPEPQSVNETQAKLEQLFHRRVKLLTQLKLRVLPI